MTNSKTLRSGGDPRALPDYVALCDEMMKLSHPARPDVEWKYAEMLCLRLFQHNGVELQTTAWYTLARMHIIGLAGMNEGLALINALTKHQWSVMWPNNMHARAEIITGLNQRLQALFRTLAMDDGNDLPMLYQSEKTLTELTETLARHELKQASRTDLLQQQVRQAITRLENRSPGKDGPAIVLPPQAMTVPPIAALAETERLVYVVEQGVGVAVVAPAKRPVRPFLAGACAALLIGGGILWGWNSLQRQLPGEQQLVALLTPLPDRLSAEQLAALRHSSAVTGQQEAPLAERARKQLKWLVALPADWPLQYGQALITQTRTLWPDNPEVLRMQKEWQRQAEANAQPLTNLNSWHNGMVKLQQLADKLNALDEKRGKYMTVSELKSQVFATLQAFNQNPPAEEQLRQLAEKHPPEKLAIQMQSALTLKQLLARYFLLTNAPETTP